ncbi:proline-rich protein 36-like [Acipenser ruthenus]|uniref:proline-rich protein 36-like n=1 Tax=Acipenser ruthenus TaxID=7906 RepID=UPI002741F8A2|nr:proline-rich protein 36-like [Acipenser ruthenus]
MLLKGARHTPAQPPQPPSEWPASAPSPLPPPPPGAEQQELPLSPPPPGAGQQELLLSPPSPGAEQQELPLPPPPPLAEGECLLVPHPPSWEDCLPLPPPPAEGECLLVLPQPSWEDCLPLPPPPAEDEYLLVPPQPPWEDCLPLPAPPAEGHRVRGRSGAPAAASMARGSPPEFAFRGSAAAAVAFRGSAAAAVAFRGSAAAAVAFRGSAAAAVAFRGSAAAAVAFRGSAAAAVAWGRQGSCFAWGRRGSGFAWEKEDERRERRIEKWEGASMRRGWGLVGELSDGSKHQTKGVGTQCDRAGEVTGPSRAEAIPADIWDRSGHLVWDQKNYSTLVHTWGQVNAVAKLDAYPMPQVDELLDKLGTARFISTLDLTKGYWQIPLTHSYREKITFSTPDGLFHFITMLFGLHDAPTLPFILMDQVLHPHHVYTYIVYTYIDDMVILVYP